MSIRQVIFTSAQNLKPPFLCQYLIFFNDFFFTLEISFGCLLKPKNRNLKKIAYLKVYGNFKYAISRVTKSPSYKSNNSSNCLSFFTDVNECNPVFVASLNKTIIPAGCDQLCHNTQGNYTCSCNHGFQLLYDGKRCRGKWFLLFRERC